MLVLNLGCGTKVSSSSDVINVDWSVYLRLRKNPVLKPLVPFVLSSERRSRFNSLPSNIMVHDLSKGLPFEEGSVDAVYHSHLLEHLDRGTAREFLSEVRRVLVTGGVQRIVVPDLEHLCREYVSHLAECEQVPRNAGAHDDYVAALIEQSVRREAAGTSQQAPTRRAVENALLGDARRRGETHQWMYDRVNLAYMLEDLGYRNVTVQAFDSSRIPGWDGYGLDRDDAGGEYKPGSLYLEAEK